ncbi:serine hydrolase [Pseudoalteromonas sp. OOF1S-7]|uniref:serine hydrolase domain-containing protein n=1 Tax=Pseudoalteromonas sp. OOF1S-7 TaxID=2917757 RepID=UPI001EF4AA28|nr:serine hydrolase [Pseudoalteromonas sp. OOF1S-7]MCG7533374.1 beta-lactamase family protein [Pseudoalteromonas sp. OOF1S-7]
MKINFKTKSLITFALLTSFSSFAEQSDKKAPVIEQFSAQDSSYALEKTIPDLKKAFINSTPENQKDGIPVGELGVDGGDRNLIFNLAQEIANNKHDLYDSLLIAHQGKLIFESYYSRGRIDLPHFQMSATKSYTALAIGRAIQRGYLTMADLDRPIVSFLKELNPEKFVKGAEDITLHEAMSMRSGLNINWNKINELEKFPEKLKGQALVQAYLENSAPVSEKPKAFRYQNIDADLVMQVLDAVVPGDATSFIKNELLDKMGISIYRWDNDISGLPTGAYGTSMTSRDMIKWGTLVMNKGEWQGRQLLPAAFIAKATSEIINSDIHNTSYGYFWWHTDMKVGNKNYLSKSARGGGGQYIMVFEELDLLVVVTSHNKLGSDDNTLMLVQKRLLPAFVK